MRIAYFDCFAGLSGDMTVAALLSAGMPEDYLRSELAKLSLSGYHISTRLIERSMISAVKFTVELLAHSHVAQEEHAHLHDHDHSHHHAGGHGHHDQNGEHYDHHMEHEIHVHQHGLSYAEIQRLIGESDLSGGVKRRAQAIFHAIGEAEARIHAMPLERV